MFQAVFSTLYQIIVPISIPVICGALLKYFKDLETRPLITIYLYFLSPAIILDTLTTAEISFDDVYKTVTYCILNLLVLCLAAKILGKLIKLPSSENAALTMVSTLTNSVNYGLPPVLLAFGSSGLDKASVYVVTQMILVNTIGVYFAARSQFSIINAAKAIFSLPAIYAALLAIFLRLNEFHFPNAIANGISMVSLAYSPIVLAILGAQMMSVKFNKLNRNEESAFWSGLFIRLILSPFIALFCLYILNIESTLFLVLFILSCMPVAVNAGVLAEKFNSSSNIVANCILWTTLASFIILPILITVVR
ncbi:AEC family transporter [Domibacillus sp. DTU_2020_1001157_1_SI_ALB_TIR_016]|uniref:AEC family transporter n=1 Tax=Domibacillus sp. DTU_2020_1001157_1_SI_ALB_TIR_016 TaxID=3077789 RepID=UPI0028E30E97|nr:AEC family transporter [Domibacillus sp. DTU_2020_1001157_1_SI_ALB_TIR_016]WNS78711.1 AEC family transporter [Domibacillus sp. DTU_2020_1001157_1_SI_ALB_TIR_016]